MTDYSQPDLVSKRVRFFDGQYLQDQDFIDEQHYHLDRERRVFRALKVSGVVDGLGVTASGSTLTIAPGTAVDTLGRVIVLGAAATLRVTGAPFSAAAFDLRLVWRQAETDLATVGGLSARRWDETPMIAAVASDGSVLVTPGDADPTWDGPTVLLARVTAPSGGDLVVDATATEQAGLRIPGVVGIGTATPGAALEVRGQGGQTVDLLVSGRLRSNTDQGGLWVSTDRFIGGYTNGSVGLYNNTAGWGFVMTQAGHVGVGTPTPENSEGWWKVLDVYHDTNAKLSVRNKDIDARFTAHNSGQLGAPPGLIYGTKSNHPASLVTNGAARLTVTADGSVGIGTTTPTMDSWSRMIDVVGAGSLGLTLRSDAVVARMGAWGGSVRAADQAGMYLGTQSAHSLSLQTNKYPRILIGADGHVSVGDTPTEGASWSRILDVYGSDSTKLTVRTSAIDGRVVSGAAPWGAPAGMVVGTGSLHSLSFATNGATRMVVSHDGHFGFGVYPDKPWDRSLDVYGAGSVGMKLHTDQVNTQFVVGGAAYGAPAGLTVGSSSNHPVSVVTNGASRLTVSAAGDVGIGTEPGNSGGTSRTLDVLGTGGALLKLRTNDVQGQVQASSVAAADGQPTGLAVGTATNHPLRFRTNGAERVQIDVQGRVGIGTGSAVVGAALDVRAPATGPALAVTGVVQVATQTPGDGNSGTALYVDAAGRVGVNTSTFADADGWYGLLDVWGLAASRLGVKSKSIDGRVQVVETPYWGAPAGLAVGTGTAHPISLVTNKGTRLTVAANGDVGIGTTTPENAEGWVRTLDVIGYNNAKVSVRSSNVDGRVMAHEDVMYGSLPGQVIGTKSSHAVSLATAGVTRLTVTSAGKVGIGTTSPGANPNWPVANTSYDSTLNLSGTNRLQFRINTQNIDAGIIVTPDIDQSRTAALWAAPAAGALALGTWSNHTVQIFSNSKPVLSAAYGGIRVEGSISYTGAISQYSDLKLKTEVAELEGATGLIERLRGVRYRWSEQALDDVLPGSSPEPQLGVIAQEVAQALPELVHTDATGLLSVDYSKLTAVLVQAVKELGGRLAALETRG